MGSMACNVEKDAARNDFKGWCTILRIIKRFMQCSMLIATIAWVDGNADTFQIMDNIVSDIEGNSFRGERAMPHTS